jgi:hypothetical protein
MAKRKARNQTTNVSSGEDDEGSKRLCLFHGTTLRFCMVKSYVLEETLGFVIEYLHEFEHVCLKEFGMQKTKNAYIERYGKGLQQKFCLVLNYGDLAHDCVPTNTKIMSPWIY